MKEGWEKKKLGEVAEIEYGTRVVQKKDGGTLYPVYGGGGATFRMDTYNREDRMVIARFAMSPQCTRYVNGKFFLNDSGLTVSPNNKELKQDYLDRALFSLNNKIYSLGKGAAQKNLDMKAFKEMLIPVPPLSVQESIVSELDMLSGIISKHKALQEEYDRLEQSIFYDMFGDPVTNEKGWEVKKLGEVAEINPNKKKTMSFAENDEISFLPMEDLEIHTRYTNCKKKITKDNIGSYTCFKDGDVLLAKVTPCFENGKIGIANNLLNGVGLGSSEYHVIRPEKILADYILFFLQDKRFVDEACKNFTGTSGLKRVSKDFISAYPIPLPPLSLQQSFADKISAIEQMKAKNKAAQEETEMLFNERMAYYF